MKQYEAKEKSDLSILITLDNQIHPLFARYNMCGMRYKALVPALRLATLLLTIPCLMDYWYAAFLSLENLEYADDPSKTYKAISRKKAPMTAKEIAELKQRLLLLIPHVRFFQAQPHEDKGFCASTIPGDSRIDSTSPIFSGCNSDIVIGKACYEELYSAYDQAEANSQTFMTKSLCMAITLCHELAHAAKNARFREAVRRLLDSRTSPSASMASTGKPASSGARSRVTPFSLGSLRGHLQLASSSTCATVTVAVCSCRERRTTRSR